MFPFIHTSIVSSTYLFTSLALPSFTLNILAIENPLEYNCFAQPVPSYFSIHECELYSLLFILVDRLTASNFILIYIYIFYVLCDLQVDDTIKERAVGQVFINYILSLCSYI